MLSFESSAKEEAENKFQETKKKLQLSLLIMISGSVLDIISNLKDYITFQTSGMYELFTVVNIISNIVFTIGFVAAVIYYVKYIRLK